MERPQSVSTMAVWSEDDRAWLLTPTDPSGRRHGLVQRWTPTGVLAAEEPHVDGQRDGVCIRYDEMGRPVESITWRAGVPHGPASRSDASGQIVERWEHAFGARTGSFERACPPGRYADPRIVWEHGTQRDGAPETMVLLDASGRELARMGPSARPTLAAISGVLQGNADVAALEADGQHAVAVLAAALARQAPDIVRSRVARSQPPLSDDARTAQTRQTELVASDVIRLGGDPSEVLSVLLDGLRAGADAGEVLRQAAAALDALGESLVAAPLVEAAIALSPDDPRPEYTRALICMSLGDPEGADASIARLGADPTLSSYRQALFADLSAWVSDDPRLVLATAIAAHLAPAHRSTAPPLASLQRAVRQGATRLVHARQTLRDQFGERSWLPPDLSHLVPQGPAEVELPTGRGVGLLHAARRDMMRLRWLCWTLGLDTIEIPTHAVPDPQRPSRALALVVLARGLLLQEGRGDISRWLKGGDDVTAVSAMMAREMPASEWFGRPLASIDGAQRGFAFQDELSLYRMMIEWWGDPGGRTCFDPHPDDEDFDEDDYTSP